MTHTDANGQGEKSLAVQKLERKGTHRRTYGRTEAIALPDSLMRSVTNHSCSLQMQGYHLIHTRHGVVQFVLSHQIFQQFPISDFRKTRNSRLTLILVL